MDWGLDMKINIPKRVRNSIQEIHDYIARDSIMYAEITVKNIYSKIYELKASQYLGRYVPELEDKNYLEIIYKN